MQSHKDQYLVYARKSTDDQENQKNSLPYQVEENIRFAEANGLRIARVTMLGLMDDGIIQEKHSGYATSELELSDDGFVRYEIERPKFQRMAKLLLDRKFKGVICLCWDRISRNEHDGILIKKIMDSGVDVRFVQVTYDKTSSGALHRDIDGMFSQHYSRVISEKVRNTFDKFRREGRCIGPAPIGYLDQGSASKPFDPIRAPIVRRMFDLYTTGEWSISQLAHWTNQQGLTTKPRRPRRMAVQRFDDGEDRQQIPRRMGTTTVAHMLANTYYIGQHRDRHGNSRQCQHSPLIDTAIFLRARETLRRRNVGVHPTAQAFFTYRALLRCSLCTRQFSPYVQKGITYYRCRCKSDCQNKTINLKATEIDNAIAKKFDEMCFTDDELAQIEAGAADGLDRIAAKRTAELDDLHRQRERIFADLDYLKKNKILLLRTGASSAEDYTVDVTRSEQELDAVYGKMNAYKETETEMLRYVLSFSELIKEAGKHFRTALDSEKREMALLAFTELTFGDGNFAFTPQTTFSLVFSRSHATKNTQDDLSVVSGSGDFWFSELPNIFRAVRASTERMHTFSFLTRAVPTSEQLQVKASTIGTVVANRQHLTGFSPVSNK
jgi:site-specific DNA recombinase